MIDPKELEQVLRDMQPRQVIYELVKAEMVKRGRWKTLKRGWHVSGNKPKNMWQKKR